MNMVLTDSDCISCRILVISNCITKVQNDKIEGCAIIGGKQQ